MLLNLRATVRWSGWWALVLLAGCGGGGGGSFEPPAPTISQFTSDQPAYFVGDQARLTAVFANGMGVIQPGNIAVTSGQPVTTRVLDENELFELTVSDGRASVTRNLTVTVGYRERMRSIPMPFARAGHAALSLLDGRLLILAGEGGPPAYPSEMYVFDPATETFSPFGELISGRTEFVAISLDNGDVLISGGLRATTGAPDAEIVNGRTGAVAPPSGAPIRRRLNAAGTKLMDGRVLIVGGVTAAVGADPTAEIYDPATGTFTLLPGALAVGRSGHTVVRISERTMLVYGGLTNDLSPAPPELYDPIDGVTSVLPLAEASARYNHSVMTMQDGGVWILGGEDMDDLPMTSVLRFDPAAHTFSQVLSMATPRSNFAVTRLKDARMLIAGGLTTASSADVTNTSELLTLDRLRRDGPSMSTGRQQHTVTRLANNKLLIVGGLGADRAPLATAEIFD